jgi:hypothetical protein
MEPTLLNTTTTAKWSIAEMISSSPTPKESKPAVYMYILIIGNALIRYSLQTPQYKYWVFFAAGRHCSGPPPKFTCIDVYIQSPGIHTNSAEDNPREKRQRRLSQCCHGCGLEKRIETPSQMMLPVVCAPCPVQMRFEGKQKQPRKSYVQKYSPLPVI